MFKAPTVYVTNQNRIFLSLLKKKQKRNGIRNNKSNKTTIIFVCSIHCLYIQTKCLFKGKRKRIFLFISLLWKACVSSLALPILLLFFFSQLFNKSQRKTIIVKKEQEQPHNMTATNQKNIRFCFSILSPSLSISTFSSSSSSTSVFT